MKRNFSKLDMHWVVCPAWLNELPAKAIRFILKAASLPFAVLRHSWLLVPNAILLLYVEMPLTTRCTLRCKNCSNLMQYYNHTWSLPYAQAIRYIDALIDTVDYIHDFGLIGGESLLYRDLPGLIKRLCASRKIGKVSLTTNGTLLPVNSELLSALSHKKVYIKISNYGKLSYRLNDLTQLFDKWHIEYKVLDLEMQWYDFGKLHFRGRDAKELCTQFTACATGCLSYVFGKLHCCPRSSHGTDLGLIPDNPRDYAALDDPCVSKVQRRKQLRDLLEIEYVTACNYCDKGTPLYITIPAAEQMTSADGIS